MSNAEKLSDNEIKEVVKDLAKLEPGLLPFEIFHAVTRLVATPIIEVVPIRLNKNNEPEILLLSREPDDPVWPNQLHVPGTVIRGSDTEGSFDDAFNRVSKELGGVTLKNLHLVKNIFHHSGRGMEVSQIYWADLTDTDVTTGEFFSADSLPKNIVQSQLDFIPDALANYIDSNSK